MNEQQAEDGALVVIDPLRAPARDLHETWREDATKTVGQLVAEGVDRKEAQRRIRWARRQVKRMAEMDAFIEDLAAKRSARLSQAFAAPIPADTRRLVSEVGEDGAEGPR